MKSKSCPICKAPVSDDPSLRPFCSERCKLIDLGNWASEKYRIPGTQCDPQAEEQHEPPTPDSQGAARGRKTVLH